MIVDTSVIMAILQQEPEAARLATAIDRADHSAMSAPNFLEAAMLLQSRKGDEGVRDLDLLTTRLGIAVEAFSVDHARLAREAFRRFGKGRHPAGLNFGDCIAYALARHRGAALLFKGLDCTQTDIPTAPY